MLRCGFYLDDADDGDEDDDGAEGEDACYGDLLLAVDLGGLEAVELAEEEGHHCFLIVVSDAEEMLVELREGLTHYVAHDV